MKHDKQLDLLSPVGRGRVLTVGQLTLELKNLLEDRFSRVCVSGEISGCRRHSSGHCYLSLKDEDATLQAVLFRGRARYLRFDLKDGMEVMAWGRISVFAPRGQYQLIIDRIEPKGLGALHAAFEALKAKLDEEGLFDSASKQPIPRFPKRIGVVTSPTGAAVHDLLRVLGRRNRCVSVIVAPARVQGEGAASDVARQLRRLDERGDCDVLVVTRGGGSLEDLWAFNEEELARAIFGCRTPVVSAVGHEIDITIADLVADLRAPTPSAAAEMLVPERRALRNDLLALQDRLERQAARSLEQRASAVARLRHGLGDPRRVLTDYRLGLEGMRFRLESAARGLIGERAKELLALDERLRRRHPRRILAEEGRATNELAERLARAFATSRRGRREGLLSLRDRLHRKHPVKRIEMERGKVGRFVMKLSAAAARDIGEGRRAHALLAGKLDALSPLRVLARGYALVSTAEGRLVRAPTDVDVGADISIRLASGEVRATVSGAEAKEGVDDRSGGS